jgi:hypothetical protein
VVNYSQMDILWPPNKTLLTRFGASLAILATLNFLSSCQRPAPTLAGVFAGTIEIDHAFSDTIPFGQQLNLPIIVRNPRPEPLTFEGIRLPTSFAYGKGNGSSGGSDTTFTVDAKSACLIFCRFYVGPATDNVDAMNWVKVDFTSPIGGEHVLFRPGDGDIDLAVYLQFRIKGQDSGKIPLVRYHIDPKKRRAVPVVVARDLRRSVDIDDLKLCDLWGQRKTAR